MKTYNYIYKTTNLINGKIYIGQHKTDILNDGYLGSGIQILYAIKKYGQEHFTKTILAYADNLRSLDYMEKYYIKKYKAQDPAIGYNLAIGGRGHTKNEYDKTMIDKFKKVKHFNFRIKLIHHYTIEDFYFVTPDMTLSNVYQAYQSEYENIKKMYDNVNVKRLTYNTLRQTIKRLNINYKKQY